MGDLVPVWFNGISHSSVVDPKDSNSVGAESCCRREGHRDGRGLDVRLSESAHTDSSRGGIELKL